MAQADSTKTRVDSTRVGNLQTETKPKTAKVASLPRSNDHLMLQAGYTGWAGAPDSIQTGGIPRTFNGYLMFDFPFKTKIGRAHV